MQKHFAQAGLIVGAVLFAAAFQTLAFSEPSSTPPAGDAAIPLNVSSVTQDKNGWLQSDSGFNGPMAILGEIGIGISNPKGTLDVENTNGNATICLNGSDAAHCISSWPTNLPSCPKGDIIISDGSGGWQCAQVPVSGACGSSNGKTVSSAPSTNLCNSGSASSVSGSGPWTWSCSGSNGGSTASCQANPPAVSGSCGPANGQSYSSAPTSGLCNSGTASGVSGSGPWSWSCNGSNGGGNASCSANISQQTFNVANDCAGYFCASDSATANEICVEKGMHSAVTYSSYSITTSNPYSSMSTGNEAYWAGSWITTWAGQCNTGGRCTPENWNEIDQITCQ